MINQEQSIKSQIQADCKYLLASMIDNINISSATFPLIPITYTLWRKSAYQFVYSKIEQYNNCTLQQLNYNFFRISQQNYLPKYIQKVQKEMNLYCRGLKQIQAQFKGIQKLNQQQEQAYDLVVQLGESVWQQQLYLELLYDLLQLPQIEIISRKSSVIVKSQYQTGYVHRYQYKPRIVETICNKVGETFVSKTLQSVTKLLFSKALVFQVNTLLGTFNPILMGASYGLTSFMNYRKSKKQQEVLIDHISDALKESTQKAQFLKSRYHNLINQIDCILSGVLEEGEKLDEMKKLKKMFLEIFQEQWLQIQELGQEDGFQVVHLEERESFQELM